MHDELPQIFDDFFANISRLTAPGSSLEEYVRQVDELPDIEWNEDIVGTELRDSLTKLHIHRNTGSGCYSADPREEDIFVHMIMRSLGETMRGKVLEREDLMERTNSIN